MADEVASNSQAVGGPGASNDAAPAPLPPAHDLPGQESTYPVNNDETKEPEIRTAAEVQRNQRFNLAMASTQQPVVTPILIAINVAVFLVMAVNGVSLTHPSV